MDIITENLGKNPEPLQRESQNPEVTDPITSPTDVPKPKKSINKLLLIALVFIIFLLGFGAAWYVTDIRENPYKSPKVAAQLKLQEIVTNENLCDKNVLTEVAYENYTKGQIMIGFNWDLKLQEAVDFLNENSLEEIRSSTFYNPLQTNIAI